MARGKGRSGRRYVRDNRGRFASKGAGATARGGRLKTAGGNKRATQTMKASGAKAAGTISKPKGLKPGAIKAKPKALKANTKALPAAKPAAAAKPARAKARTALKRTGGKVSIPSLKTNTERGRKGIVSMSTGAKQARRGAVAERKAERRARVVERQSGIVARRQGNRLSTYSPSGAFNQAAQNLNQSKLKKSKQIQSWLTTRNPADKPQSRRQKQTAAKPAAAAKPARRRSRAASITPDKTKRITERINRVTAASSTKTGVKRLNATEVSVRAKAFVTRKIGGMSGLQGKTFEQQQAAVKASLAKPTRYSTQKPNRNKPSKFNNLGQSTLRAKNKAAQAKPASPNLGKPAQVTSRGRTIKPAENFKPAVKGKSAPDNARTRANKLKTAQNRVKMYSETDSRSAQNAIANRDAALKARPQGTPGNVVFRSRSRASSRFQQRANDLTTRINRDLKYSKPGAFSATGGGGGKGIVRRNTGDKQTSLFGKPASLYTNKTTKSVKRRSGNRK